MSKILKRLNDNQNKVADTNGIMKLQAWDDGVAQDLTNKKITATVANASGFLFDLDLVSNGTEIDLDFKDSQLQKLTPDTYFLEIKVTDEAGDISVFPTKGYAIFTINKNLHATEGDLVPQITFDTVLADVKKAVDEKVAYYTSTIAKGDKGDKGDPGKDAEMPVIGGRNYLLNSLGFNASASKLPTLKGVSPSAGQSLTYLNTGIQVNNTSGNSQWYYEIAKPWAILSTTELIAGETYTMSLKVKGNVPQIAIRIGINNSTENTSLNKFSDISESNWTRVVYTFTIPSDTVYFYLRINGANNNQYDTNFTGNEFFTMKELNLEAGNVATDWTPAPEDVPSNDSQLVHKTGNETVAGDKTFTGRLNASALKVAGADYTNTVSATTNYLGVTISFMRIGRQVTFTSGANAFNTSVAVGWTNDVLPNGFKPALQQNVGVTNQDGENKFFSFDPSGSVYNFSTYTSGTQPRISGTYITTDSWPAN